MKIDGFSDKKVIAASQNIKEKNFWTKTLSGEWVKTSFPYDFRRTGESKYRLERIIPRLPEVLISKLFTVSKKSSQALHIMMAAGLAGLLYRYNYNNPDIVIGSPIYKQKIQGEFINTILPLRIQLSDDITFKELLEVVKQTVLAAVAHQNYPIELLVREFGLQVQDEFPLFDTVILLEDIHKKNYISHTYPNLTFSFSKKGDTLEGMAEYNTARFEKASIERFFEHFVRFLKSALFTADAELACIDFMSNSEKQQLLVEFNDTQKPYPDHRSIPALFEEQVEKMPGEVAVIYRNNRLTFNELNGQADRLARHLRSRGVKAGMTVGIMVEHSFEMIVGVLGILKAGGAYLPIDTKLPLNRIITMLEDSGVSFLLTPRTIHDEYSITAIQDLKRQRVSLVKTEPRPQIRDLDNLPIPQRSLVNYEVYNKYNGMALVKNSITLQGTRGCPYKCAYCHKIWPKTHVVRSAEHIYNEVKLYYDMGVRRFSFIDDIFNLHKKNSLKFFQFIIDKGLDVHLFFPNGIRADIMDDDYIDLMVAAGTINMAFALETASPRLQKLIRKNLHLERFRHNLEYIIEKYPHVIIDLFSMHGFPTETKQEAMVTLDFIKSMKWLHFPFIWILKIFPNTDIEQIALESGVSPLDIARSDDRGYHKLPYTLPWEDGFTLQYQADFFNNYFLNKGRLLHVLPYQMRLLSEDEILQKYNSYFPATNLESFSQLLQFVGINREELKGEECRPDDYKYTPDLHRKMLKRFPGKKPDKDALRVLLLDVTLFFSDREDDWRYVLEPPLGLIYILTFLDRRFGSKVNGRIAKARIDFDSDRDLMALLKEFKPDVIGIRTLSLYKDFFHSLVAVIRQWDTDVPIVAGGPYATTSYNSILQDRNVDVVVQGEGEATFAELIEKIMMNGGRMPGDEELKEIAGIAFSPDRKNPDKRFAPQIVLLDVQEKHADEMRMEYSESICRADDPAYIIYTSGSTGKPKGVLVEHKNVIRLVKSTNYIEFVKRDRLLLTGAFGFDITTFEIWAPLLNGFRLYLTDKEDILDADKLKDVVADNRISILHLIPQLFNQVAEQRPEIFSGLRYFLVGGDVVTPEYINRLRESYEDLNIVQMYGPTENTTFSTFFPVTKCYPANIPIGNPLSNSSIYIADRRDQLVPIGAPGELWVAGDGISRGYLNAVELTREKFIPDPFAGYSLSTTSAGEGKIVYKTGDLARWLTGGHVEFLGRIDSQLKVRGFRIELGEIESLLCRTPGIEDGVVVSRKIGGENQIIVYYKKKNKIELWPSMAEYFAYDELLYHAIAHDESRNEKYRNAIHKVMKDKVVLEIGPGNEAILSRMCVEAGAKKVYAVEILESAYRQACETITKLNLADRIIPILGDITKVTLPEKVDYCVSEIVGTIGGSEGAAGIINSVHSQMKDPGCQIPCRSVSKIAAVTLPEDEFDHSFEEVGAHYVEEIFKHMGRRFDLRLSLLSFSHKYLVSSADVFEDLDFTRENLLENEHEIYLQIEKNSVMNGFIVWLCLYCDNEEVIDTLEKKFIWLPLYLPVFSEGEPVRKGDYIKASVIKKLSENKLNPDFTLAGTLYKKSRNKPVDFTYHTPHMPRDFKGSRFYKQIFDVNELRVTRHIDTEDIREFLGKELPEYMMPAYLIELEEIPLMPNGKIDRKALPLPEKVNLKEEVIPPRNEIEQRISQVWREVLNHDRVGIYSNFFEIGGDSLKAMRVSAQLNREFDITINHIFQYGTIAEIAKNVTWTKDNLRNKIVKFKQSLNEGGDVNRGLEKARQAVAGAYEAYRRRIAEEVRPSLTASKNPGNILVTGGSGFLGAHLVYELLAATGATLFLLVRGDHQAHAEERLKRKLAFYFGKDFYDDNKERLQVVWGDLRRDRMKLDALQFDRLCQTVNMVIHAAANVRHFGLYKDFYEDNVRGTEKLLELAHSGIKKDFHYISTLSVGYGNVEGKQWMLFDEFCHDVGQEIDNVYVKSKLEAEKKILQFRKKGLSASIYRVGNLLFHSLTGKLQENIDDSAFYARLKAFIVMGIVPDIENMRIDVSFIDAVARALVILMTRKNLENETFHLHNLNLWTWKKLVPLLQQAGIDIKLAEPAAFLDDLLECIETGKNREVVERLLLHSGLFDGERLSTGTRLVSDRTDEILKMTGFRWPMLDASRVARMIGECKRINFLQ